MSQVESKHEDKNEDKTKAVKTTVDYLPATKHFKKDFEPQTTFQTVRAEAMAFFGVADFNDRDRHEFHLEAGGQRVDYGQTLAAYLTAHGHEEAHKLDLALVEQVTAGGV
jgi:DNA gyrase/topoisomerase IV subunit B